MAEQPKGALTNAIDAIRGEGTSKKTNKLLEGIQRQMSQDSFDVTKAIHKIERRVNNRIGEIDKEQEVKFIKGEIAEKQSQNPFESNQVTKLYVDSLKQIVGDVHTQTREELKTNIERMTALMQQVDGSKGLDEKEFLQTQYKKSLAFLEKEHEKRSNMMARSMNKIGELSEQYLDLQSLFSGFVNHNPIMMGMFKIGADFIKSRRMQKANQRKALAEDIRRKDFAETIEKDKARDAKLAAKNAREIEKAKREVIKKEFNVTDEQIDDIQKKKKDDDEVRKTQRDLGIDPKELKKAGATRDREAEILSTATGGTKASTARRVDPETASSLFNLPEDEFSGTGDAPLSSDDLAGFFGGTPESFTRMSDEDLERDRKIPDDQPSVSDLEQKQSSTFERIQGRGEEREDDERHAEQVQYQEKIIEKFDKVIENLEGMHQGFTSGKFGGGSSGGGMLSSLLGPGLSAFGGAILTKLTKPLGLVMKVAAPLVAGAAGILGKVGLGGVGAKLTGSFTKVGSKLVGKEAAQGIAAGGATKLAAVGAGMKKPFEKMASKATSSVRGVGKAFAGKAAGKFASKAIAKSGAKKAAKAILTKIPGIGLLAGGLFAINRLMEGDFKGAGLELAAGAAAMIPGIGTAAAIAIDAGIAARDLGAFDNGPQAEGVNQGVAEGLKSGAGKADAGQGKQEGNKSALAKMKRYRNLTKKRNELQKTIDKGDGFLRSNRTRKAAAEKEIKKVNAEINILDNEKRALEGLSQKDVDGNDIPNKPTKLDKSLGMISAKFESGGRGAGTISSGRGDRGGKSYGTHQLASKTGTLQKFLDQSPYGQHFKGLKPGSREFDAKWEQLAASDPGFGQAQHAFIKKTHFDPQQARLKKKGINLTGKGRAVQEAVFSTSVQHGAQSSVIEKALTGQDVENMSDEDIVGAIQDYKAKNVRSNFRSSSKQVQDSVAKRIQQEKKDLVALSRNSQQTEKLESMIDKTNESKSPASTPSTVKAMPRGGTVAKQTQSSERSQERLSARNDDSSIGSVAQNWTARKFA